MVRTLIQFLALTCSLLASFFLIKGSLGLKANDIAELASTKFDYNPHVMNNLIEQQVNSEIGFILLLCSFILQGINMLWPMRFCDFEINKTEMIIGIVIVLIITVRLHFISKNKILKKQKEIKILLERNS